MSRSGMTTGITVTNLSNSLKILYAEPRVFNLVFNALQRPFLTKVAKNTEFEGNYMPVPVMYEASAGGSSTFSNAQANSGYIRQANFQIDLADYYRVITIETKALRKAKSIAGSFLTQQQMKIDGMLESLSDDLETSLFRTADGYIGSVDGTASSTTNLVLENAGDAKNFQVGDKLVAAADSASALRSSTTITVNAIDYDSGSMTLSANWDSQSWADGDLIWREGDYTEANDKFHLRGLPDWLPVTVSGSDSFLGVNRSYNRARLAGRYITGSLSDIEESIVEAAAKVADIAGIHGDVMFCDHTLWSLLAKEMGVVVRRKVQEGVGGFENLSIMGPKGIIEIIPSTKCGANTGWLLKLDTWKLWSAGPTVGIINDDGNIIMRISDKDGIEIRAVSFPQLACYKPVQNARIAFS